MRAKIALLPKIYHYLMVVVGVVAVLFLELFVPGIGTGLTATPFILVSTTTALFGSFGSGIFSILLSGVAVAYVVPPKGFSLDASTSFKTLEFMFITTIIFVISWRSRTLYASNIVLREMTRRLQDITANLQVQAKGDKRKLKQLNEVNHKLVSLVDQFIKDDEYWARKITTPISPLPKSITNRPAPAQASLGRLRH